MYMYLVTNFTKTRMHLCAGYISPLVTSIWVRHWMLSMFFGCQGYQLEWGIRKSASLRLFRQNVFFWQKIHQSSLILQWFLSDLFSFFRSRSTRQLQVVSVNSLHVLYSESNLTLSSFNSTLFTVCITFTGSLNR